MVAYEYFIAVNTLKMIFRKNEEKKTKQESLFGFLLIVTPIHHHVEDFISQRSLVSLVYFISLLISPSRKGRMVSYMLVYEQQLFVVCVAGQTTHFSFFWFFLVFNSSQAFTGQWCLSSGRKTLVVCQVR